MNGGPGGILREPPTLRRLHHSLGGSVLDETAEAVSHRNKLLNGIPIPIEGTVGQYFIVPFGTRGCRPKGFLYRRNPQSGRGRSNSAKEIADLRADGTPM
jgi:hypothetical protein